MEQHVLPCTVRRWEWQNPFFIGQGFIFNVSLDPVVCYSHLDEAQGKTAPVVLGAWLSCPQAPAQSHSACATLWVL